MPTPQNSDTTHRLAILQAYPLGTLQVQVCGPTGFQATVLGLSSHPDKHPVRVISTDGGTGTESYWPLEDVLPLLRPFPALALPLPGGEVPAAVEFALFIGKIGPAEVKHFTVGPKVIKDREYGECIVLSKNTGYEVYLRKSLFDTGNYDLRTLQWLWANHFAVGLKPHEFICN